MSIVYDDVVANFHRYGGTHDSNYDTRFALLFNTVGAFASPFASAFDTATGRETYQLTSVSCPGSPAACEQAYALYYHTGDASGDFLIYRYLQNNAAATVRYVRLNLVDGVQSYLTGPGTCNGEFVSGDNLYCLAQGSVPTPRVKKINLLSQVQTDTLCSADPGFAFTGSLAVNADASYLIMMETSASQMKYKLCRIADGALSDISVAPDVGLGLEHFQFSPTDPSAFTFRRRDQNGVAQIAMGKIVNALPTTQLLSDPSNTLNLTLFYHPFYGQDGALWSDYGTLQAGGTFDFIKFNFSSLGVLASYNRVTANTSSWPNHANAGRDARWFVGDGVGDQQSLANPSAIQQIKLEIDAGTWRWRSYKLASDVGTNSSIGDLQANTHYVPSKKWVVWSAYRTLNGGTSTARNIFATEASVVSSNTYPIAYAYGTDWDIKNGAAGYWSWSGNTSTWIASGGYGFTEIVTTPAQANVAPGSGQLWGVAWGTAVQWNGSTWLARGDSTHLAIDCQNSVWGIDTAGQSVRWTGTYWQVLGAGLTSLYMDGCTLRGTAWGSPVRWTGSTWVSA